MKSNNKYSHIEGKRVYTHPLAYPIALFVFILCCEAGMVLTNLSAQTISTRSLIGILLPLCMIILLLIFDRLWGHKLLCILGEDRLYFFRAEITKYYENSPRKTTMLHCSGSLPYFAIADMKPAVGWERSFSRHSTNIKLVLVGNFFEITMSGAARGLMKKIRQKQPESSPSHTAAPLELEIHQPARSGLWAEIWQAYENGAFEELLDEYTEISGMEWTFEENSVDMLDMTLVRNGYEICFNIDEDSLYMDAMDAGVDTTIALTEIGTLDNMFAQIQTFARENS